MVDDDDAGRQCDDKQIVDGHDEGRKHGKAVDGHDGSQTRRHKRHYSRESGVEARLGCSGERKVASSGDCTDRVDLATLLPGIRAHENGIRSDAQSQVNGKDVHLGVVSILENIEVKKVADGEREHNLRLGFGV